MTAVITGVGVVSAFGVGAPAFNGALAEGRSGIGPIRSFDASTFPTRVAGEVPVAKIDAAWLAPRLGHHASTLGNASTLDNASAFDVISELESQGALRDRKIAFGLLAAHEAWTRAGCGTDDNEASLVIALGLEQAFLEDFAPIFDGQSSGRDDAAGIARDRERAARDRDNAAIARDREPAAREREAAAIAWDREPSAILPHVRFRSPVDLTARAIRRVLGLRGPAVVNASACAAGALAVAHAASLIERGAASIVVCGAADSMVNPLGLGGMCRLGAPSPRNEIDACRPFDRTRDGLVIGEGAAMFVVESVERARARGAKPLATILGWGSTQDAYRVTAPRPDGAAARAAMQRALARAKLPPEAIGYINAHGTGTPLNDPAECKAIHGALGKHAERVAVSSIKGAVGHLMAASGAIEIAASLLALERVLPGTAHHRERDPECNVDVIGPEPRPGAVDVVLSNSFGFGGQNATVILGGTS